MRRPFLSEKQRFDLKSVYSLVKSSLTNTKDQFGVPSVTKYQRWHDVLLLE